MIRFNDFESSYITIQQVANGWLVQLPKLPTRVKMLDEIDTFKLQAEIMKETLESDSVIGKIHRDNRREQDPTLNDLKDDTVYMFKTFEEVSKFLFKKYVRS